MEMSQGDIQDDKQQRAYGHGELPSSEFSGDTVQLALLLITQLGACLQMIANDMMRPTNLEEARVRWMKRLEILIALITHASRPHESIDEQPHASHQSRQTRLTVSATDPMLSGPSLASMESTLPPATLTASLPRKSTHLLTPDRHTATRLTTREREILALANKGYPPRKIAARCQLSVQTVYTHLRNARRKQRSLGVSSTF